VLHQKILRCFPFLRHACLKMRQLHPGCDQQLSVFLLLRCDASILGNWLPTFRNKLAHTSSWNEISFNICSTGHENTVLCRIFECRLPSDTAYCSTVNDVQMEGVLLRETKNRKMQDITVDLE
jgi:hypothetical protein